MISLISNSHYAVAMTLSVIGLRKTKAEIYDGEDILIPNSIIAQSKRPRKEETPGQPSNG